MAEAFNLYHVWLGIPPEESAGGGANLYRLLGIRLLEGNADVIDNAADRQTAHLRTFQSGKHGKEAEKLLNEVAAARVVLLDPQKKGAYDKRIRAWLDAQKAQAAGATASQQTAPQPSDWDSLLGDVESKPRKPVGSRQAAGGSKQKARQRPVAIFAVAGVLLAVAVGIGVVALNSGSADGTLALDWPVDQREGATLTIDDAAVAVPASGAIERAAPPGEHHLAATRPLYQPWSATVTVPAGERQAVRVEWKPKAVVALDWPLKDRKGATLTLDGNLQTVSEHEPLELLMEPGNHGIRILRPNTEPFQTSVEVALGGRRTIVVPAAAAPAMLVVQWPEADRQGAQLTIDGQTPLTDKSGPDAVQFALKPGRHTLRITRAGFQPFEQTIELAATGNKPLTPTWTLEVATNTQPTTPDVGVTPIPTDTAPAKKLPIPSAEEQAKIAKQLDELYKPAHTDTDVAKANEFYDLADKARSPAEGYMLRLKGAELAAGAGDLATAFTGIDQLAAVYEIEPFEAKQKLLDKAVAAANTAEQLTALVTTAEQLLDQAIAADQYDPAMAIAASASKAIGKRTLDVQFRKEADELLARRRRDIHILEPLYVTAQKAEKALAANPDDAEANQTDGSWFCFYKSDWPRGLPLLAKGKDEKLKSLAQAELKPPADANEQVQLADAWWDASQKDIALVRDAIRLHASGIYQAALPDLTSALKKAAVGKRLKEVADLKPLSNSIAASSTAGKLRYTANEYSWKVGEPIVQLIQKNKGFCFLASVSGHFLGYGEAAGVHLASDGLWSLEAHSGQDALSARAISIERLMPAMFKSGVTEYHWKSGEPPVKMLHKENGICFLSAIEGHFEGLGEGVSVHLADDGYWYLDGRSRQSQLGASAIGIAWATPGAYSIGAEEHNWSAGDSPVKLLEKGQGFAFLSSVSGRFLGYGEEVRVYLGDDDIWYLAGRTGQSGLLATATAVRVLRRAADRHVAVPTGDAAAADVPKPSSAPQTQRVKFPIGQWIDVLRLVDTDRDAVKGTWSRNGSEISAGPGDFPHLDFPVTIDGGYDFEMEFTRVSGDADVDALIPVNGHQCNATLSGWGGQASGLSDIDGHAANDEKNPTATRPGTLENGHRYRALISVRLLQPDRASIDYSLDEQPYFPHWEGKPELLRLYEGWAMPHSNRLGLGAGNNVVFHSARLRMVSGHASLDPAVAGAAPPQLAPALPSSEKPIGPAKFPLGQWVDVLRLVDLHRNIRVGKWVRSDDEVSIVEPAGGARIVIPVAVEGSYDLETEFVRDDGSEDIATTIPVGSHACQIMVGTGRVRGLDMVNSKRSGDDDNPSKVISDEFQNGHVYRLLAKVRLLGADKASVDALIDGQPSLHWEGDPAVLSFYGDWAMPTTDHLGFGAWKARATLKSARLRMASGRAAADAAGDESAAARTAQPRSNASSATAATKFPSNKWVDILGFIDPARDTVKGRWSRDGAELSCDQNWYARIEAPVAIDGAYDLEVEFTRTGGENDANTIIPVGPEACDVVMSGWGGKASGLALIDGHSPEHDDNSTSTRPGTLDNGHRYKVLISVRLPQPGRASVDVSLDGKPYIPHWEGSTSSLKLDRDWSIPHSSRPGLATFENRVTYHAMRLRMISGRAAVDIDGAGLPPTTGLPTVVSAHWGRDDFWIDVTTRVQRTVARGEVVYASPDFFQSDPFPGSGKRLDIVYKVAGTEKTANIDEGGKWSREDYASP